MKHRNTEDSGWKQKRSSKIGKSRKLLEVARPNLETSLEAKSKISLYPVAPVQREKLA